MSRTGERFDQPAFRPTRRRALVIDNDQSHAETVAESLRRIGFHCRVATSGQQGAEMIEESPFDVVITDR